MGSLGKFIIHFMNDGILTLWHSDIIFNIMIIFFPNDSKVKTSKSILFESSFKFTLR